MPAHGNVLEMIGDTPMVEFKKLDAGPCRLFAKLENQNPGGSIKDRIGLSMIDAAARDGSVDLNASAAAVRAGYSPNGARQNAHNLLTNSYIEATIAADPGRAGYGSKTVRQVAYKLLTNAYIQAAIRGGLEPHKPSHRSGG